MHMTEALVDPGLLAEASSSRGGMLITAISHICQRTSRIISKLVPMSQTKKYMPKCQNFHDNTPPVMT